MTKNASAVGQMLHAEHLRTLARLNDLEERITGPQKRKPLDPANSDADRRHLKEWAETLQQDVHRHFDFEEQWLFPALHKAGLADVTTMLIQDHEAIRPLATRLHALIAEGLAKGFSENGWAMFRDAGMDLIPSVLFHIQKEEMSVIKRLGILVSAETDQDLAEHLSRFGQ